MTDTNRQIEAMKKLGMSETEIAEVLEADKRIDKGEKLAYTSKKETKGYYVFVKVEADNVALKEFNRLTKFDNNVLRTLVVVDHE